MMQEGFDLPLDESYQTFSSVLGHDSVELLGRLASESDRNLLLLIFVELLSMVSSHACLSGLCRHHPCRVLAYCEIDIVYGEGIMT